MSEWETKLASKWVRKSVSEWMTEWVSEWVSQSLTHSFSQSVSQYLDKTKILHLTGTQSFIIQLKYNNLCLGNVTTLFTFTCENWEDEGDLQSDVFTPVTTSDLKYTFSYFSPNGKEHSLLSYRTHLPSGDPEDNFALKVRGYVIDKFLSSAHYDFVVKVRFMNVTVNEL